MSQIINSSVVLREHYINVDDNGEALSSSKIKQPEQTTNFFTANKENINNEYDNERNDANYQDMLKKYTNKNTTNSLATEVQELFKDNWDNIISTIEEFLLSNPSALGSVFTSSSADKYTEQDVNNPNEQQIFLPYIIKKIERINMIEFAVTDNIPEEDSLLQDAILLA
ncbi:27670_t:CDS:2, partial [Gigaspora margarita]